MGAYAADPLAQQPTPPLEIIIVAYGRADLLERSLSSIVAPSPHPPFHVLVVDNSSDDVIRTVAARAGAEYVDPGSNRGFAAGVNIGLQALARHESDVLLLNPDATVSPETIVALQSRLRAKPKLACVAPAQHGPSGASQRVGWPFPTPWGSWKEAAGRHSLPPETQADFLIGSVLLLRHEALQEVGAFDESFFLYFEECDWQRRAREAGWNVEVCEDLEAEHYSGGTTAADPLRREALFAAGHEHYIRKWYGTRGWWAVRSAVVLGSLARAARFGSRRRVLELRRAARYATGPERRAENIRRT